MIQRGVCDTYSNDKFLLTHVDSFSGMFESMEFNRIATIIIIIAH